MFQLNSQAVGEVYLSDSGTEAEVGCRGGVVFSNKPIQPNTQFSVKMIKDKNSEIPDEFIFGLTSIKPSKWKAAEDTVDNFRVRCNSWHIERSRLISFMSPTEDMPTDGVDTLSLYYDDESAIRFWVNGKQVQSLKQPYHSIPVPRRLWVFVYTKMQCISLLPKIEFLPFQETCDAHSLEEMYIVIDNPNILSAMEEDGPDEFVKSLLEYHPLLAQGQWLLPPNTQDKYDQKVEGCKNKSTVMNLMCIKYPGCEIFRDRRGNRITTITSIRDKLSSLRCPHSKNEGTHMDEYLKDKLQNESQLADRITCYYRLMKNVLRSVRHKNCETVYEQECVMEMYHRAMFDLCCRGRLRGMDGNELYVPLPKPDAGESYYDMLERLDKGAEKKPPVPPCDYQTLCKRFMKSLDIPGEYFDSTHDRCYCEPCMNSRNEKLHYSRGDPPAPYAMPVGWVKFGLVLGPQAKIFDIFNKWHVAFHGTKAESVASILASRDLLMPGDVAIGGKVMEPVPGHFTEKRKPQGFDVKQVFVSPTIRYAGLEAYAQLKLWVDTEAHLTYHYARVVLVLRIKPGSYTVGPETVLPYGLKRTLQIDPQFSNNVLEWSTKERGATIPIGVMVKLDSLV